MLLQHDVDSTAGVDDDTDDLVDDVDALEDVDGVFVVGDDDVEDVDAVEAVVALDTDDDLVAGGGEGIVGDGASDVGVMGEDVWVLGVSGQGTTRVAEGEEGSGGRCWIHWRVADVADGACKGSYWGRENIRN